MLFARYDPRTRGLLWLSLSHLHGLTLLRLDFADGAVYITGIQSIGGQS